MAAVQPLTNQLIISFFSPSPTPWDNLTVTQRASCTGTPKLQKQIEQNYAWPPDGELRDGWNSVGKRTYNAVISTGPRPDKISPPQLWLLSKSDQQDTAVPHVVITCKDIKHGNNTIKHLEKNDQLTRFGLPYLPRKSKMKPVARTSQDESQDDLGESPAISLCAARIAVYTGSASFNNPKRNTSTVGCVLQVGQKRYALTAAHVFFTGVDTTKSWHESRVSITTQSRQRDASRAASDWSFGDAQEPQVSDVYKIDVESLWPHRGELLDDVSEATTGMIGRVTPREAQDRTNRGLPEIVYDTELDWALIELPPTAVLQSNCITRTDGSHLELFLPDCDSDPDLDGASNNSPPSGEMLIMCGVSGQVSGRGLGTVGGILLPWRKEETEAWSIECDIAVGDSGSLAVNPSSGRIYGLVVSHDSDIMLTYIVPIHAVIRSIRQQLGADPSLITQDLDGTTNQRTISRDSIGNDSMYTAGETDAYYSVVSIDDDSSYNQGDMKDINTEDSPTEATVGRRESNLDDGVRVREEFQVQLDRVTRRNTLGQSFVDTKALSEWTLQVVEGRITNLDILLDSVYLTDFILPVRSEDLTRSGTLYLRVFCLLLDLGHGNLIHWCRRLNLQDSRMPYDLSSIRSLLRYGEILQSEIERIAKLIYERQWAYCAVWFDTDRSLLLDPRCILPFIQRQRINVKGATAELHEVSVPENFVDYNLQQQIEFARFDNRTDGLGPRYSFAVKTFSHKDRNLFKAERDAFHLLKGNRNFIQCFGDFAAGDEASQTFNLVLEYGDLDLAEHYALATPPALLVDICEFWERMSGVVAAIADLHNFSYSRASRTEELIGSHHDIKPDNILLVNNKLKLADPGFALFNRTGSRLGRVRGGTIAYGPPEFSLRDPSSSDEEAGQSADMWSLGCVLSEAATWVVLGRVGIDRYSSARLSALRQYEQIAMREQSTSTENSRQPVVRNQFHDGRRVLSTVREWHDFVRQSLRVTDSITGKIMDIIDDSMLVEAGNRDTAETVLRRIDTELQLARKDVSGHEFTFDSVIRPKSADQPSTRHQPTERSTRYLERIPVRQDHTLKQGPSAPIAIPRPSRHGSQTVLLPASMEANSAPMSDLSSGPGGVLFETVNDARSAMSRDFAVSSWRRLLRRKPKKDILLSRYFADREIIFLVDNAASMKEYWSRLVGVLEVLASKVQGEDGFEVRFTIGKTSRHVSSSRTTSIHKLVQLLHSEEVAPLKGTGTDMSDALIPLMSEYLHRVRKGRSGQGLSIIILTDGRWSGTSVSSEVAVALANFFKILKNLNPSTLDLVTKLGIEFVTFGDDSRAMARFEELRRMSFVQGVPDVVDVEPSTGNIYKMLLGNFVEQYDYDKSVRDTPPTGSIHNIDHAVQAQ